MIQLVPHIYYHPEEVVIGDSTRVKRESVLLKLAVLLGIGLTTGIGGIGTEATALIAG